MSVVIKGMEMPKACFWRDKNGSLTICPLCDADGYCGANGKQRCLVPENEMPNDCPLIELQSHGRLIAADELLNDLIAEDYKEHPFCYPCGEILRAVKNAPAIIEAEH